MAPPAGRLYPNASRLEEDSLKQALICQSEGIILWFKPEPRGKRKAIWNNWSRLPATFMRRQADAVHHSGRLRLFVAERRHSAPGPTAHLPAASKESVARLSFAEQPT